MKKSAFALITAAALAALAIPAMSGCSADVGYTLHTAEDGSQYYSVRGTGFLSNLSGELEIPAYIGEGDQRFPVTEIENAGFSNAGITKVTIPATVTKLGTGAFSYCTRLSEVSFAEGSAIDEIPWGIFGYCESLQKINIPDTVKTLDGLAFYGCIYLKNIDLPAGLETINQRAFEDCSSLATVEFPDGLTRIGPMAFYNCSSLTAVVLPDSLVDTETPVLDDNGEEVTDENGQTEMRFVPALGYAAFHTCTSLKTAVVGAGITCLQEGVFGYCTALEEVYLPAGLKEVKGLLYSEGSLICGHAFHNNDSLSNVYFAGTEEEWAAVEVDNTYLNQNGAIYDNSALLDATITCGIKYQG